MRRKTGRRIGAEAGERYAGASKKFFGQYEPERGHLVPAPAVFSGTIVKIVYWTEQRAGTVLEYDLMHKEIPCAFLMIDPDSERVTLYQIESDGMTGQRCFQRWVTYLTGAK